MITNVEAKNRISILSQLANVDGEFDVRELAFLYNVCLRNNIDLESIGDLISEPEPVISLNDVTADEQVQYLVDVLMMMMIDGKVLPSEVRFCLEIGTRLGFDTLELRALISEVSSHTSVSELCIRYRVESLPRRPPGPARRPALNDLT